MQFAAGAFGGPLFDLFGPWVRLFFLNTVFII
jgi:hypothetical protein